jgi:hypothetical protein
MYDREVSVFIYSMVARFWHVSLPDLHQVAHDSLLKHIPRHRLYVTAFYATTITLLTHVLRY